MRRLVEMMCAVLVSLVAVTACSDDEGGAAGGGSNGGGGEGSITIGVITSSSGPAAATGLPEEEAIRAFAEAEIDCGGQSLEFRFENDQSDPAQAAAIARTLVGDDTVVGILGPSITSNMLSAAPIVLPSETPILFLTPNPYPNYNEEPYAFSPNFAPFPLQAQLALEFLDDAGYERPEVPMIAGDDATGQAVRDGFAAEGVTAEAVAAGGTDFVPVLRDLAAGDPEHFQIWLTRGGAGGIARRQQVEIGFDVPTLMTSALLGAEFFEAAGDAADGVFTHVTNSVLAPDDIEDPEVAEAAAAYQDAMAAIDRDPLTNGGILGGMAWDGALSMCRAVADITADGGVVTRESIRDALEAQEFVGAGGRVERSETDHAGFLSESFVPVVIEQGAVYPAALVDGAWERAEA